MASIPWGERPLLTRSAYFSTQLINPVLPLTFTVGCGVVLLSTQAASFALTWNTDAARGGVTISTLEADNPPFTIVMGTKRRFAPVLRSIVEED
jgi:hypothetical protein